MRFAATANERTVTMKETTVSLIPRAELAGMERDLSYTDFVVKQLSKRLADRLVQILATEGEVVVSMSDLMVSASVINHAVEYRRQIEWDHLVRCKDCKHAHLTNDKSVKYCDNYKDDDDGYITVYFAPDHYCSYGERKDGKQDG